MMVSEIFESIQGEGPYAGLPCGFVRVAGCNFVEQCPLDCDTKYAQRAQDGKRMSVDEVEEAIYKMRPENIVFTGGEPTIYWDEIVEIVEENIEKVFHLETNGVLDITKTSDWRRFKSIVVSPKTYSDIVAWFRCIRDLKMDNTWLKVVVWDDNVLNVVKSLWAADARCADEKMYLMPYGQRPEDMRREFKKLMEWEIENRIGVRITPRLQILFGVM